jgi:hypothetical protein
MDLKSQLNPEQVMRSQSTFNVYALNSKTRSYEELGLEDSDNRDDAVSSWISKNPGKASVILKMDNMKIVAIMYGGGI